MNLKKEHWWFHIVTIKDKTEMALFVMRYISCLLIFVLGLKAPGIPSHLDEDYIHLESETNTVSGKTLIYSSPDADEILISLIF